MEGSGFLTPLFGGLLIGLATALMLLANGRITGISGMVGSLFSPRRGEVLWRVLFLGGLVVGGWILTLTPIDAFPTSLVGSPTRLILAGICVGIGTRLSGGCTSGHGVCGVARLSQRSITATIIFIATGALVVTVQRFLP